MGFFTYIGYNGSNAATIANAAAEVSSCITCGMTHVNVQIFTQLAAHSQLSGRGTLLGLVLEHVLAATCVVLAPNT